MSDSLWSHSGRPPGSSVRGIFQARILECFGIAFSRGSSKPRDQTSVSCIGRQILYHWAAWDAPDNYSTLLKGL